MTLPQTADVVIVGAGITGLAAAHHLQTHRPELDVVVLEAGARAGGKVETTEFAGHQVDTGADQFLARQPEMVQLCGELDLAERLITPQALGAYLLVDGVLRRFPTGLLLGVPTDLDAVSTSGILSDAQLSELRLATAGDRGPALAPGEDASVGDVVRGAMGDGVVDRLVAPLLAGVHAGDIYRLSVRVAAPQIAAAAEDPNGLLAGARDMVAAAAGRHGLGPVFQGLHGGTGLVVERLVDNLGDRLYTSTPVGTLRPTPAGVEVCCGGSGAGNGDGTEQVVSARRVIVCTPADATAAMVGGFAADAAAELGSIGYTPVVLATLAFLRNSVGHALDGTGYLVPPDQVRLVKGCTWTSRKFAHLDGDDVILRVSAGSRLDPAPIELSDDELLGRILDELGPTLSLTADPTEVRVTRWHRALPQYDPGHLGRVTTARAAIARRTSAVHLAGAAFEGLGLPACVRQGRQAAQDVLESLSLPTT